MQGKEGIRFVSARTDGLVDDNGSRRPTTPPRATSLAKVRRTCTLELASRVGDLTPVITVNFGRIRNADIGNKPGAKGAEGEDLYAAFFGQSAFAEHALVVENSIVKVPSHTDLITLSPLGCGLQTGAGAVINLLKPAPDSSIAIYGLGAVGIGALFAAVYLGVKNIIAVDIVPSKLELAKSFGAQHAVNGKDTDAVEQIKKLTLFNGGTNFGVEATGNVFVLKNAYASLANRGHLVSCGTPGPGHAIPFEIHDNLLASKT